MLALTDSDKERRHDVAEEVVEHLVSWDRAGGVGGVAVPVFRGA